MTFLKGHKVCFGINTCAIKMNVNFKCRISLLVSRIQLSCGSLSSWKIVAGLSSGQWEKGGQPGRLFRHRRFALS